MNPLFRDSPSPATGPAPAKPAARKDQRRLAAHVRRALREGRIPGRPADQMWGGPGSGAVCAICDQRLESHAVEYELEFAEGRDAGAYHVHVACCMAWEAELS
jgi:hypothetical protein